MSKERMIHDPIHGTFYLPDIAWNIVDTVEFQRLRWIKQTGNTYLVYPGAEHSRFAHSLGVAHLSYEYADQINRYIDEKCSSLVEKGIIKKVPKILCAIAGLVHDLGHCAFSHVYDNRVVPKFDKDTKFSHELASYRILVHMYNKYSKISSKLTMDDINIIGKMIFGSPEKSPDDIIWYEDDLKNRYIYQIVCNELSGIDVDKFDYIVRDSYMTGVNSTFNPHRLTRFLEITNTDDVYNITYGKKGIELINDMWKSRENLHRRVFKHRVVERYDKMTIDMIYACRDHEVLPGIKLSDIHKKGNEEAYILVTDSYIYAIADLYPIAKNIKRNINMRINNIC